MLTIDQSAVADKGFWYLAPLEISFPKGLPVEEETGTVLVSTSGQIKTEAINSGLLRASEAVTLGPGEPVFGELVEDAGDQLRPYLYQGGLLEDPTTVTDYELHLFEAKVAEGGGRRETAWSYLIRVDETGTRLVAWETLSNLEDGTGTADRPHPALMSEAEQVAQQALWDDRDNHTLAMGEWIAVARNNLRRLPNDLSDDIPNREQRQTTRSRIEQAIETRIADLDEAVKIEVGDLSRIGWARVSGAAETNPEEKNSEEIAMRLVIERLAAEGWRVSDVHTEGRGYDCHARRGHQQRCVEVKGIWDKASSRGVTLTGNEMVRAGLLGDDYWLYIVDRCSEGGVLYHAYQNPATLFADLTRDITSLHIKGSDLEDAK